MSFLSLGATLSLEHFVWGEGNGIVCLLRHVHNITYQGKGQYLSKVSLGYICAWLVHQFVYW